MAASRTKWMKDAVLADADDDEEEEEEEGGRGRRR